MGASYDAVQPTSGDAPAPISIESSTSQPPALAPWAAEAQSSLRWSFVARLIYFLLFIPTLFAMAVWMRYWLIVATLLVSLIIAEFFDQVNRLIARFPKVKDMGMLGKSLNLTISMREFYSQHKPAWFFYYLFYPLTAPVMAIIKPIARRELGMWSKTFLALILGDLIAFGLSSFSLFPPYLGFNEIWKFALGHVLLSLFFAIACLMPVSTTVFTLSLAGRAKSLRVLSILALLFCGMATFGVLKATEERISPESAGLIESRLEKKDFRYELGVTSEIILTYLEVRTPPALKAKFVDEVVHFEPKPTRYFRSMLGHLAPHDEPKVFNVLSMHSGSSEPGVVWYGVEYVTGTKHYLLFVMDETGQLHRSWEELPTKVQKHLVAMYKRYLGGRGVLVQKMAAEFPNN